MTICVDIESETESNMDDNDSKTPLANDHDENDSGFDILYEYVPSVSLYQMWIVFCGVWLLIPAGTIQLGSNVLQAEPDAYSCLEGNSTRDDQCCDEYLYESEIFHDTAVMEWDLVCNRSHINTNIKSIGLFGLLFGAFIFGYSADRFGRKNTLLIASIGTVLFSFGVAFSPNITYFAIFRFLSALCIHASVPIGLVYGIEFVGPRYRPWVGCALAWAFFDIGIASLSLIAFLFPSWRNMALVISLLPVPYILMYFLTPPSMQFLYSKQRVEEAEEVLQKLFRRTKANADDIRHISKTLSTICSGQKPKVDFFEIFSVDFRLTTIESALINFASCCASYGFLLNSEGLSGNLLVNNAVMALFDLIGYVLAGYFLNKAGRVRLLKISFLMTTIGIISSACLSYYFTDNVYALYATKSLVFIGKLFNSMSFGAVFSFVSELYPTHLRGTAVGFGSAMARIGGILAPQIIQLKQRSSLLPPMVIGIISLFGAVVTHFMPETNEHPLMQTTEEAQRFYKEATKTKRPLI